MKLEREPNTTCITLYLSNIVDNYIRNQTNNRSQWIADAGKEFLRFVDEKMGRYLDMNLEGIKTVSITKPDNKTLKRIYRLVSKNRLMLSRSDFYRMSAIFKIIFDMLQEDLKQEKKVEKEELEAPNTVRVPIDRDENGDQIFKVYKVLQKLEF